MVEVKRKKELLSWADIVAQDETQKFKDMIEDNDDEKKETYNVEEKKETYNVEKRKCPNGYICDKKYNGCELDHHVSICEIAEKTKFNFDCEKYRNRKCPYYHPPMYNSRNIVPIHQKVMILCANGKNCEYKKEGKCKFYHFGDCRYGDNCKYKDSKCLYDH